VFVKYFTISCWARQTLVFMSVYFQNIREKMEWTWTKCSKMIEYRIPILSHSGTETNVPHSGKDPVPIMELLVKNAKE